MFERFTEKAIKVITQAQKEAIDLEHSRLYPEHLLLGIVMQTSGIASKFLKAAGVKSDTLRARIKDLLSDKQTNNIPEILPFSEDVKKVLTDAWDKSKILGNTFIIPEHLFLALSGHQNILDILAEYNVDVDRIVSTVIRVSEKKVKTDVHPEGQQKPKTIPSIFEEAESINVMNKAVSRLKELNLEALGTEQIIESILEDQDSEISKLLAQEGVEIRQFREKLAQKTSREEEFINNECLFTPRLYTAIKSAFEIAKECGSSTVTPDHILLGILKNKGGIGYNILKEMGVNTQALFGKIVKPIENQKPSTMTIIKLAKEEARRLWHNVVGTELILLGILGEGSSIGARVLNKLGITLKDARKEVENIISYGNYYNNDDISFTPRAKRLLEIAWNKAKCYNSPRIESEHLLLAIIEEKECIAMKVLEYLGVDAVEIRQGVIEEIDQK